MPGGGRPVDEGDESVVRALVAQAQRGDPEALNDAFFVVRPEVERWVALRFGARLRTRLDIEDIVQETLAGALESLHEFEYEASGAFLRWLRTIAENRLRDADKYFRRKKRDAAREEFLRDALVAASTTPSGKIMRMEERERLLEALSGLSQEQRDVIRLIRFEGLSYAEAGERLGVTSKAAGVRLVRAMKALRRACEDGERSTRWPTEGPRPDAEFR